MTREKAGREFFAILTAVFGSFLTIFGSALVCVGIGTMPRNWTSTTIHYWIAAPVLGGLYLSIGLTLLVVAAILCQGVPGNPRSSEPPLPAKS